jgi:cell division protein FtsI/penicillin-binding protein 2
MAFKKAAPGRCPAGAQKKGPSLGLREATRDSINIWFARLAVMMDGKRAKKFDDSTKTFKKGDPAPPFPQFELVATAHNLGFGETALDLAINVPDSLTLRRWRSKRGLEGDVLYAHPGLLDLMDRKRRGLLWVLAQNAIGQGITASPLQMARVCAAIPSGKIPHPYIFHRLGEEELKPPQAKIIELEEKKLRLLRKAMRTVPDTGTARGAFLDHTQLCRIYGKTGTANVGLIKTGRSRVERRFHTTWFIGWREPKKDERPLAFACMVTHARGKHSDTGAEVCAPIMAEILKGI